MLIGVCLLVLAWAALHDVAARTIPNRLVLALALAGLALHLWTAWPFSWWALAVAAGAVAVWRLGLMGGGDAKLLAAAAVAVPAGREGLLVAGTAMAGAVLALGYLALGTWVRRRPPAPRRAAGLLRRALRAEAWRLRRLGPLPYGIAIAAGATFCLACGQG